MKTRAFELSKWYADCVTDAADALILYSAELRWRGPAIHYNSLLTYRDGKVRSRFSLRQQPPPLVTSDTVEWKSRAWKAEGRWCGRGSGIREVLFDSPAGSLEWDCIAPRASADLRIEGGVPFRGWGYVEHLRLSVAPWRLPIQQLRWGRFVNAADTVVWIDWRGPHHWRGVYHNGARFTGHEISDERIVADGELVLTLRPAATLRDGRLGATALAAISHVERIFPARILNVREHKWLSRATLRRPGCPDSVGMAIHEVVEWP